MCHLAAVHSSTDKQTDRQTDRETDKHTDRWQYHANSRLHCAHM